MRAALVLTAALGLVLGACGKKKEAPPPAPQQKQPGPTTPAATPSPTVTPAPTTPKAAPAVKPTPEPPKTVPSAAGPKLGEIDWSTMRPEAVTREQVRKLRADRRAFEGAPPMIPHPDDARTSDCLSCHGQNVTVGGVKAPRMSHEKMLACRQCHVARATAFFAGRAPGGPPPTENSFEGLASGPGHRATPTAPPTVPHGTHMREACGTCHGRWGQPGLRTSHPERVSCNQCHVPSLNRDSQHPPAFPR